MRRGRHRYTEPPSVLAWVAAGWAAVLVLQVVTNWGDEPRPTLILLLALNAALFVWHGTQAYVGWRRRRTRVKRAPAEAAPRSRDAGVPQ